MADGIGQLIGFYILFRLLWQWLRSLSRRNKYPTMPREIKQSEYTPDTELETWLSGVYRKTDGNYFPESYLPPGSADKLSKAITAGKIEVLTDKDLGTLYRVQN